MNKLVSTCNANHLKFKDHKKNTKEKVRNWVRTSKSSDGRRV